jgi:hypothetical protein
MSFDGKTLTVLGKNLNIYAQQEYLARSTTWSMSIGIGIGIGIEIETSGKRPDPDPDFRGPSPVLGCVET